MERPADGIVCGRPYLNLNVRVSTKPNTSVDLSYSSQISLHCRRQEVEEEDSPKERRV